MSFHIAMRSSRFSRCFGLVDQYCISYATELLFQLNNLYMGVCFANRLIGRGIIQNNDTKIGKRIPLQGSKHTNISSRWSELRVIEITKR